MIILSRIPALAPPSLAALAFAPVLAAVLVGGTPGPALSAETNKTVRAPHQVASKWGDYLAGHHAESNGDAAQALKFYQSAIQKGIDAQPDLHSRLYILNLTEGRLDAALKALADAQALGADAPLANLTQAVGAIGDGDFARAQELLDAEDGGMARVLGPALKAWVRYGQGDADGALAALDDMQAGGDGPAPLEVLHTALLADLTSDEARAVEAYGAMAESESLSLRTAELVGAYFERQGAWQRARDVYDTLGRGAERDMLVQGLEKRRAANTPAARDVTSAADGAAEALYGVASALLSQSAWESAMALGHMANTLRPDFPPALLVVGGALEQNARRDEANAIYDRVDDGSPFSWLAGLRRADNLDRMGDTQQAVKQLSDLARSHPRQAQPLIELGDVLRRHERFSEAANAYSRALERIDAVEPRHWVLFYSRGISYEQTDRWPQAEEDFLKALELNPEQPLVLNYLGYSWIDQGLHLERAIEMIETAVEKRPRDGYIVDSLGWGKYRLGDYAGAVKHLERAVMLRPADAVINDHLGDALWQVGRTREARFQWERALAMDPDAELAKELERKLKNGLDDRAATSR